MLLFSHFFFMQSGQAQSIFFYTLQFLPDESKLGINLMKSSSKNFIDYSVDTMLSASR